MEINSTMSQNVDTLFSNIESFTQNEGMLGKPVSLGEKTLIPVVSVTIGFGGGNSSGKMSQGSTTTSTGTANTGMDALGLGAKISTDAVVLVDGNNVSVLPVNSATGNMSQLINQLPQMMGKGQTGQQQGQQGQQQSQSGQQWGQS